MTARVARFGGHRQNRYAAISRDRGVFVLW